MKNVLLVLITLSVLFISCEKEAETANIQPEEMSTKSYPNADERLWVFFQTFEIEANKRGLSFDLRELNILGKIEDISEEGVAGHCRYGNHIDNEVTIDSKFWSRTSDLLKEFIVFHELGHCVLLRGHDETIYNDGTCESLMRSGIQNCRDNYSSTTRARYLDELFSEINS